MKQSCLSTNTMIVKTPLDLNICILHIKENTPDQHCAATCEYATKGGAYKSAIKTTHKTRHHGNPFFR